MDENGVSEEKKYVKIIESFGYLGSQNYEVEDLLRSDWKELLNKSGLECEECSWIFHYNTDRFYFFGRANKEMSIKSLIKKIDSEIGDNYKHSSLGTFYFGESSPDTRYLPDSFKIDMKSKI